jgi:hypothetical protein
MPPKPRVATRRGLPVPPDTARPDVPADIGALAAALDAAYPRAVSGSVNVAMNNSAQADAVFPVPAAVRAWPGGWTFLCTARHSGGNFAASTMFGASGAPDVRVSVFHRLNTASSVSVAVDYVFMERL